MDELGTRPVLDLVEVLVGRVEHGAGRGDVVGDEERRAGSPSRCRPTSERRMKPPGPTNAKNGAPNATVRRASAAVPKSSPAAKPSRRPVARRRSAVGDRGPVVRLDRLGVGTDRDADREEQERRRDDVREEPRRAEHRGIPGDGAEAVEERASRAAAS